jgi:hypothetical protein
MHRPTYSAHYEPYSHDIEVLENLEKCSSGSATDMSASLAL